MSYTSEVTADSPLAWWRLDDTTPSFADSGSNGASFLSSDATTGKSPLLADGGTAVAGSGTSPIATLSSVPSSLNGANVTLEAWVKIPATASKGAFVKIGKTAGDGWGMGIGNTQWDNTGSKLILLNEAIAWVPTTHTFSTGIHHVMVVRGTSGAVTAYVDGSSVWTGSLGTPNTATAQMGVGGYTETYGFKLSSVVDIDNVAVYAAALAAGRATAHYNSGSGDNTAVAADSPVIWLKLDESITVLADSSGNGRTMPPFDSLTYGTSPANAAIGGSAITLASGMYGVITTPSWLGSLTTFSVESWFKTSLGSTRSVLSMDDIGASAGSASRKFNLYMNTDGTLVFMVFRSGAFPYAQTAGTYDDNAWHHVAGTCDGTMLTIYVDGVSRATQAVGGTQTGTTVALELGATVHTAGQNYFFVGSLDEAAVYGSALSPTRVLAHYNAGIGAVAVSRTRRHTIVASQAAQRASRW